MNRGEIWLIDLDPTIGAEIRKTRPAVIVSDDEIGILPLKIIVPITEWKERYAIAPWMIRLEPDLQNNLDKVSCADTFQVRSLSSTRFVRKIGSLPQKTMREIVRGLSIVLAIEE